MEDQCPPMVLVGDGTNLMYDKRSVTDTEIEGVCKGGIKRKFDGIENEIDFGGYMSYVQIDNTYRKEGVKVFSHCVREFIRIEKKFRHQVA